MVTVEQRELVNGGDPDGPIRVPSARDFDLMGADFIEAPTVRQIASLLIARHDGTLAGAAEAAITYLWKRSGGATQGKATLGMCVKLSGLAKHGVGGDFVIWIAADHCRDLGLTAWQLEALIFHELCHVGRDEDKPTLAPHDYTGFVAELREYGTWHSDLLAMARAAQQLPLF